MHARLKKEFPPTVLPPRIPPFSASPPLPPLPFSPPPHTPTIPLPAAPYPPDRHQAPADRRRSGPVARLVPAPPWGVRWGGGSARPPLGGLGPAATSPSAVLGALPPPPEVRSPRARRPDGAQVAPWQAPRAC